MRKKAEQKTAEEYRASAEAHQQAYKNQWKTFLKSGIFTIAALVALLVLTTAWFVNNSRVDIDGISITAENNGFELRSYGENGLYDDDIISKFFQSITVGKDDTDTGAFTTTTAASSISWLVSDKSNLGNYSEKDVNFTGTGSNDRKDYAIEPGSEGHLTFYIVPDTSGTQTFQLSLSVLPYRATVNAENAITNVALVGTEVDDTTSTAKSTQPDKDDYARQFISGHILFFLESETASTDTAESVIDASNTVKEDADKSDAELENKSSGTSESADMTWLQDGSFEITIENAEAKTEYGYTIYWKWPQVFSEIVLNQGDGYLNGRDPILNADLRTEIVTDMTKNPQKYFYNSLTKLPLTDTSNLVAQIASIHKCSSTEESYNAQSFVDLSSFYNQADQLIGNQISFILVQLSAESGGTEETEKVSEGGSEG